MCLIRKWGKKKSWTSLLLTRFFLLTNYEKGRKGGAKRGLGTARTGQWERKREKKKACNL